MTDGISLPAFDPRERRPVPYRRVPGLRLSKGEATEQGTEYFLKAPSGQLLVLGEHEQFLWESLDGTSSFAEIEKRFRSRFGVGLANAAFAKFVSELIAAGAIEPVQESEGRVTLVTLAPFNVKKIELADDHDHGTAAIESVSRPPANATRDRGSRIERLAQGRIKFQNPISFSMNIQGKWFAAAAKVYWPIRYVSWMLVPLALAAFLVTYKHSTEYLADWTTLAHNVYLWPCFWLTEHFTTFTARKFEGMVIYGFGGTIVKTHFKWFMILIRLKFEERGVTSMPRRSQLWIAASPLLWRLFCFALPQILWAEVRALHPLLGLLLLLEAFMGLLSFFMCCLPVLPLYGYKFLTILLGQENLRIRAFRLVGLKLRGLPAPYTMTTAERWGLFLMGSGTIIFSVLYFGNILYQSSNSLVGMWNGFGGWLMLAIFASTFSYFYALWRFSAKLRAMQRAARVRDGPPGRPAGQLEL